MSRTDSETTESSDAPSPPRSFGGRVRLAFREDPTKGVVVLLLMLLGLGFLLAGLVAFWNEILAAVRALF